MRPVEKGSMPATYTNYADALPDLVQRLGRYCSYCERYIMTNLAVEHVQPKSLASALALLWSNFLVACVNCNSCKGDTAITLADYLWPDNDNTLRAYQYSAGGIVTPHSTLSPALTTKAQASLTLVGLDRIPGAAIPPTPQDLRWNHRREAWGKATRALQRLTQNNTTELREQIVETAVSGGFFSVWWIVFRADVDMQSRLRAAFVGTCPNSFDASGNLLQRPSGQL